MDFIKNLISGILSFVTGLLRGKKSNGYFLELDEAKDAAKDAAKEVASNAKKVAETVSSNAKKVTATAAPEAPEASKPASLNGTKTAAAKTKEKPAKNPKPADVTLVQTAEGLKVEPGKKAKAAAAKVLKEEPKETTFAPKYLAPSATSSNGRRRPGANMSAYLDMARQVKTPG
jgi:primosomal protein N'